MQIHSLTQSIGDRLKKEILMKYNNIQEFSNKTNFSVDIINGYINSLGKPSKEFYQLLITEGFDIRYILAGAKRRFNFNKLLWSYKKFCVRVLDSIIIVGKAIDKFFNYPVQRFIMVYQEFFVND